jgi:hypothetical protein
MTFMPASSIFAQHFFGFGLGTDGADDFGLFHVSLHG